MSVRKEKSILLEFWGRSLSHTAMRWMLSVAMILFVIRSYELEISMLKRYVLCSVRYRPVSKRTICYTRPVTAKKKSLDVKKLEQTTDKAFDKADLEASCKAAVTKLQKDIAGIKQGKQNPSILNNLKIPPQNTTLGVLANVAQKNPKTFLVTVYDPAHVKFISSAIASSGNNFNPQPVPNNTQQLTINIPKESTSNKAERIKLVTAKIEVAKTTIRHARADSMKLIKSDISTDSQKRDERVLSTILESTTKEIDRLLELAKRVDT